MRLQEKGNPCPALPGSFLTWVIGSGLLAGLCHGWAAEAQKPQWFWPVKLPSKEGRHCVLQQPVGVRSPQESKEPWNRAEQDWRTEEVRGQGQGWNRMKTDWHAFVTQLLSLSGHAEGKWARSYRGKQVEWVAWMSPCWASSFIRSTSGVKTKSMEEKGCWEAEK